METETFKCSSCKAEKPLQKSGGTGFGTDKNGAKHCYACIAEIDKDALRNLSKGQKIAMYFEKGNSEVSNWPGTLRIPCTYRKIRHNFGIEAYAISFFFEGNRFYGRNIGYMSQLVSVKKAKK